MREIKFRAWHKAEKKMCDVNLINFDKGAFLVGLNKAEDTYINGGKQIVVAPEDGRFCEWDEFELVEFTGLKDKNGTPIYEGDILKYSDPLYNWLISFNDGGFVAQNIGIDGYLMEKFYIYQSLTSEREVIGNIYQNKELL